MNLRDFKIRLVGTPVLFLVASLLGVITSSWWASALLGLGFAFAYTFLSERIGRQVSSGLAGAVRGAALAFHFFQVLFDTAAMALVFFLFSFLGLASVPGLGFTIMAAVTWFFLARESLVTFIQLCLLWLATRR